MLVAADDPWSAAEVLQTYLASPDQATYARLEAAGVPATLVDDFRSILPKEEGNLPVACALGAAWEVGRRSTPANGQWSPVATWVGDAQGFRHRTAESLVSLIIRAKSHLRLFAPFVDEGGLKSIVTALAAATSRGVWVDVAHRQEATELVDNVLTVAVDQRGDPRRLRLRQLAANDNFPHLKLLTVDSAAAYVGSANLTWAALVYNVELGVLVDGPAVAALEQLFDLMVESACVSEQAEGAGKLTADPPI